MRPDDERADGESRAPGFGTWRRWYAVVLGTLAALVALFEWLSVHYR
jgi:hypothetical protein